MKALTVTGLKKRFGGVAAVDDLSFHVEEREALGIIGPNGAGKTTVFNLITGLYRPDGGRVEFFGSDITGIDPVRPMALGIARTFQNLRLFKGLTVLENVIVPILVKEGYGPVAAIFMSRTQMKAETGARRRAAEILDLFHLSGKADALAGSLPYGEQRRVELARALAANPRLLLIDEPGAGMNPEGNQGTPRRYQGDQGSLRPHHPHHRASDGPGHASFRPARGHGLRQEDRGRTAR